MTPAAPSPPPRFVSLDALRGFDMFWILGADAIVVALGGLTPSAPVRLLAAQLEHRDWAGFSFYDLIFPMFVFIVGVSLVFALDRTLAREGRRAAVVRLVRRVTLLVLLGIFYNGGLAATWPDVRLTGVLQRIGFAYGAAGLLYLYCRPRTLAVAFAVLLAGYWALLSFGTIRDFPLTADHLQATVGTTDARDPRVREAFLATTAVRRGGFAPGLNLTNHFDFQHLPGGKYDKYYDPEGLLSMFPAIATCLLGVFAGRLLQRADVDDRRKVTRLLLGGTATVAIGWLWHLQFPVVKKLWTSSFVLVAGGYSLLLLAAFYYVVDVRQWRRWCAPFVWIGMNPITLYLSTAVISYPAVARRFVGGDIEAWFNRHVAPGVGGLLVAVVGLGLVVGLAGFLHRRRIFLRV